MELGSRKPTGHIIDNLEEEEMDQQGKCLSAGKALTLEERPMVKDFDDILTDIGGFGPWQRLIYILISIADIYGAFAMMLPVFVGATPIWNCDPTNGNLTLYNKHQGNITLEEKCTKSCIPVFEDDFTSVVGEWSLVCEYSFVSDLITSIQMAGLLVGAGLFGQLSDLIGRKKSYYLVYLVMTLGGFASAFANSWPLYAACRAIVGFGFGGYMVIACVFPMEFMGKKYRVFCGTVGFWALGTILLALIAFFLRDWRHLTIATSITGLVYILSWSIVPESPRWLLQHQKLDEAEKVLSKIACKNGCLPPDPIALKRLAESTKKDTNAKKYTYLDLLRNWKYAKRTLIMFFAWFTTFVLYYELSYNLKHLSGNRYFNMLLSGTVDWVAMISVIFILNILGRRRGLWFYLMLEMISLLTILVIIERDNEESLGTVILAFALIGKSACLCGTYAVQIYSAELFPTDVRNLGVGSGSIAGRIGGIVAPQIVFLGTLNKPAPYIICLALSSATIPLTAALPETKGKPLDDTFNPESKVTNDTKQSNNI